ncbi:GNAT family N-acyltransferase [Blastococcus sp. HT6-30]|uniref:GNAT family N-acetyltransferase n=1 Tax=Blastococcus sp. HT6-30 TaxID=3144843 RepID=UPI00321B28CE
MPASAVPSSSSGSARYRTYVARPHEVAAAQRLRHRVLDAGCGARTDPATVPQHDGNEWDDVCDHLVVWDEVSDGVVGTCHLLPPERAMALGRSYGDGQFDLSRHAQLRPWTVAAGRRYVHPEHRSGAVTSHLSAGLLRYVLERGHPYLAGRTSVPLTDGGSTAAAVWDVVRTQHLAPAALRVVPHVPFDVEGVGRPQASALPPLVQDSLRGGGVVCGRPAHDRASGTAEFYVVMPLADVAARAFGGPGNGRR